MAGSGQSVSEALSAGSQMESSLKAGLRLLSEDQVITFVLYNRVVLPYDGFVFWVRAEVLNAGAMLGGSPLNTFQLNQPPVTSIPAPQFDAKGSLHFTTINTQEEATSYSTNKMVFTSEQEINDLSDIAPNQMYIATTGGQRYAFKERSSFYRQANLYHYSGHALFSSMASQVIDFPEQLNMRDIVVSNSLPIWLTLNAYFPVYPGYLVPSNLPPPYAAVHIGEDDTTPMTLGPFYDQNYSRWQQVKDHVKVTTYGIRNNTILDWLDYVQVYTEANFGVMGIMNTPIPRDAKQTQAELGIIAQKKIVEFDVNYYQLNMRAVARQLIRRSFLESFLVDLDLSFGA